MPSGIVQWQDYVDVVDDVMPYLQINGWADLGGQSTALAQNLTLITSMCCDWIQETMGKPIAPTTFTRRFDGWSGWMGAYIELPYYPVVNVVSMVEYRGVSGAFTLTESTPTNQVDGYQIVPETGRITRVFPGNVQKPFFPGSRNIEITWQAGYNPIPPRFRVGTLEMIAYWWRNHMQQSAIRMGGAGADEYDAPFSQGTLAGTPDAILDILFPNEQVSMG